MYTYRTYVVPVQADPSTNPLNPSEFNVHAVFERYTLKFCTRRFTCQCWALYERFFIFFFFCQIVGFCTVWGIWVLRDPIFPAKKNKNKKRSQKALTRTHCTRVQIVRVQLSETAWKFFGLLCREVRKARLGIVITWFWCKFDFGI